jgi:antitoxin component YwqK of YwqJK toxin-antitoxin module
MEWFKHFVIRRDGDGIRVNGWKQGTSYLKRIDGQLWHEGNYDLDKDHGVQRGWYDNSRLRYEINYKHGQLHGVYCTWLKNGQMEYKANYVNGDKQN